MINFQPIRKNICIKVYHFIHSKQLHIESSKNFKDMGLPCNNSNQADRFKFNQARQPRNAAYHNSFNKKSKLLNLELRSQIHLTK